MAAMNRFDLPRGPWSASVLAFAFAAAAAPLACNGKDSLPPPISDNQADDPCAPASGSQSTGSTPTVDAGAIPVSLPGGASGIAFDDMRFSPTLAAILVPAGRTGNLDLMDPSSEAVSSIGGFSSSASGGSTTAYGVTSADEGNGTVYATDRTSRTLAAIDAHTKTIEASLMLASTPGYVRYAAATNEVWVSEPDANQLEIASLHGADGGPGLTSAATVAVGGAESLEIDSANMMAFTNKANATIAVSLSKRSVIGTWPNGCTTARGIAIDPVQGWVIVACEEGMIVTLSEKTGAMLGVMNTGAGIDRIAYDSARERAYVPSPAASSMTVVGFNAKGVPTSLGSVDSPSDAHCAVTPGDGEVFVCAPSKGEIVFLFDPF
jgi:hypothetical protein